MSVKSWLKKVWRRGKPRAKRVVIELVEHEFLEAEEAAKLLGLSVENYIKRKLRGL